MTILIWIGENGISCLRGGEVSSSPICGNVDTSDEQPVFSLLLLSFLGQEFSQALEC